MGHGGFLSEYNTDTRARLLALIEARPGLHLRAIPAELGVSLGAVRYHLVRLEARGDVEADATGRFTRWFRRGAFSPSERALIASAHIGAQRAVIAALVREAPLRFEPLRGATGVPRATLSRHVNMLVRAGVVLFEPACGYRLLDVGGAAMTLALVQPGVPDAMADHARGVFDSPWYERRGRTP